MSPAFPSLSTRKVMRILTGVGFYIHHQKGSHVHFRHLTKTHLRVTVPYHTRFDLPPTVIASILKQAEITREEFLNLL